MTAATKLSPPSFLRLSTQVKSDRADDTAEAYQPLPGLWLTEMALDLGWYRTEGRRVANIFVHSAAFFQLTGLRLSAQAEENDESPGFPKLSQATIVRLLKKRLAILRKQAIDGQLPLYTNVELFGRLIGLSDVEKAILTFATVLEGFNDFRNVVSACDTGVTTRQLARIIAKLSGHPEEAVRIALGDEGLLVSSGLITVERGVLDLQHKIGCSHTSLLLQSNTGEAQLTHRFLKRAGLATLTLDAFPHLATDIEVLKRYLRNALQGREPGANVLFYGAPGTGKTELAKALAESLDIELFEVPFADMEGDLIKGEARLRELNLCQKLLARTQNAVVMFDEIEDVFNRFHERSEARESGKGGKAWINRTLERNATPAIWITNDPDIDPAYLRRFDYSVRFPIPPQRVRVEIARHHLASFGPSDDWLARIAANEQTFPAQIERAAKVARIAGNEDMSHARGLVEQALDRSAMLLNQKALPARNVRRTAYDLEFVNADADIGKLIAGLRRQPRGSFCFYGVAGTGKSELARYIADEIGKPVLLRRASDILSMWVGEAEKNIAAMFAQARQEASVVILDEADSFLADRRDAQRSWEITQVNELLTQMESFEGIFICTTNLLEKLDPASLRRFAFKLKFDYLTPIQCWAMYRREFARLGGDLGTATVWEPAVRRLDRLTPGDFAVAAGQYELLGASPTAGDFYGQLRAECAAKEGKGRPIGFVA